MRVYIKIPQDILGGDYYILQSNIMMFTGWHRNDLRQPMMYVRRNGSVLAFDTVYGTDDQVTTSFAPYVVEATYGAMLLDPLYQHPPEDELIAETRAALTVAVDVLCDSAKLLLGAGNLEEAHTVIGNALTVQRSIDKLN